MTENVLVTVRNKLSNNQTNPSAVSSGRKEDRLSLLSPSCLRGHLLLLLGVRSLHDQGLSGDEWRRLLQLLLAAVEFGRQGSADRPHVFSCGFVKGASLQNMLHGLLFSTTGASWRGCQLQFTVHMTVQSVMTGLEAIKRESLYDCGCMSTSCSPLHNRLRGSRSNTFASRAAEDTRIECPLSLVDSFQWLLTG